MRSWSTWVLTFALVTLLGCRRSPPPPSAEYDEARVTYEKLYASQLDDAYGDPQMDQVVALLKKVSKDSSDAESAKKLLERIDVGKKEFARQQAESEARRAAMRAGPPPGSSASSVTPPAFAPTDTPPGGGADAGSPTQDPFAPGASIAVLNREAGGCLVANDNTFAEKGSGKAGVVYTVSDSRACQQKVPGLQGQALLVVDGKLYRRVPARDLIVDKVTPGTTGQPGAQKAAQPAAAQPQAVQPPASTPPADSALEYTGPKPEQPNAPQ